MILVFDLDDTLYDEVSFVKSGFRSVANYLEHTCNIPPGDSFAYMLERLKFGRGDIFDKTLSAFGCFSHKLLLKCIRVYRTHEPDITLFPEADDCLKRFRHCTIYIVTDGNKVVQNNKIRALRLSDRVKFCFISHRYGIKNAKPSPYCFLKIVNLEKVAPQEVVYIGDNPAKDFVGIKPLGFQTVRVLTGQHRHVKSDEIYEAYCSIRSLDELTEMFLENLKPTQSNEKRFCR